MFYQNLTKAITNQLTNDEQQWLAQATETLNHSDDIVNDVLNLSVVVKRKVLSAVNITEAVFQHCDTSEIIRIYLLISVFENHPEQGVSALIKQYYQAGDSSEKCALLKGLMLLDSKGVAVNIAVNAARCNSAVEFKALALNNDYPATFFAELNFNQLVLKALFMGVEIAQFMNLALRRNAALSNMCVSYLIEQALAERTPPASLWLAVQAGDLVAEHEAQLADYTKHFFNVNENHKAMINQAIAEQRLPSTVLT